MDAEQLPAPYDPKLHDLWAVDLVDGEPRAAHRIVLTSGDGDAQIRHTECHQVLTAGNHPEGWWYCPKGEIPLAGTTQIHCGLEPVDV